MQKGLWLVLSLALVRLIAAPAAGPQQAESQSPRAITIDASLVPIRVVVRDSKGQTIGGLAKEDFQIFDGGAPQKITQFFAEHLGGTGSQPVTPAQAPPAENEERIYTVYLFDDLHISQSNLMLARDAASRHFAELDPVERVAIFTTSGQRGIDFTLDRDKLRQIVAKIKPLDSGGPTCPKLTYYQADLIRNHDEKTLDAATADALICEFNGNPKAANAARQFAQTAATEVDEIGRALAERSLRILKELVLGMSKAPGRSTIVVVSSGIFIQRSDAESEIEDLAIRRNITVNFLEPQGLVAYLPDTPFDARDAGDTVLRQLSYATGGTGFGNNNDLNEGFRRLSGAPEYSYVLAFSPDPSNLDGKFHKLKVKLATRKSLHVQARNGYFASKPK